MAPPTKPSRQEPRPTAPRNPSIDSAVSSISSSEQQSSRSTPSNSHRPSQEVPASSRQTQQQPAEDLASYISSAGSIEAALQSLWKERQSTTTHNAQLWRLVEKQRAMILGLNKDLERVAKDKERYRKKLKEHLAQQPPLPNGVQRIDSALDRSHSQSPAPSDADTVGRESLISEASLKPLQRADSDLHNSNAPTVSLTQATPVIGAGTFAAPSPAPASSAQPQAQPQTPSSHAPPPVSPAAPSPTSTRKAPPTPLNLAKPATPSAHLYQQQPGEHSDSDYDDTLDDNQAPLPPVMHERGRRKTREEDDALREAQFAIKSDEERSQSKKKKSKSMAAAAMPLSPRAPRQAIPLPPTSPLGQGNVHLQRAEVHAHTQDSGLVERMAPPAHASQPEPQQGMESDEVPSAVYRGLVDDRYPGLLLPPNALPGIDVAVFSSRMRPSRHSMLFAMPDEDPVFQLGIYARSNGVQLWRVEKTVSALARLHQMLLNNVKAVFTAELPDRELFNGHAPAKIDARREALNGYFSELLDTEMNEHMAVEVCRFFSDNPQAPQFQPVAPTQPAASSGLRSRVRKEGYLTKRGKNFGGWKARYFVLEGTSLTYYDAPDGQEIGRIKLANAQIGKQQNNGGVLHNRSPSAGDSAGEDNEYRHAFLVLEPKRKDEKSLVRHVLCAESDVERDAWVDALLQYVEPREGSDISSAPAPPQALAHQGHTTGRAAMENQRPDARTMLHMRDGSSSNPPRSRGKDSSKHSTPDTEKTEVFQSMGYDEMIAQQAPVRGPSRSGMPSPPLNAGFTQPYDQLQNQSGKKVHGATYPIIHGDMISGPTGGVKIEDASMWGNKPPATPAIKDKKRSIFAGFRGRSSSDLDKPGASANSQPVQLATGHPVFGVPLADAVEYTQPAGIDYPLPSVVYRCIEYLRAQGAIHEEGIFRLSGSNLTIKGLRDRFNTEGDVKLLEGEYYDVHAVGSLLKLYLRELPTGILTRELHLDFLKALDLEERQAKITAFNLLVHRLPAPNLALLQALCSFLIEIVDASATNKMNVRNVSIVFAPTLNIPTPLISFFLTDYNDIYGDEVQEDQASPVREQLVEAARPQAPASEWDGIRSPRHQMFSDLATPAYNQTSFQNVGGFAPMQQGPPARHPSAGMNGVPYGQQQQQQADYYQQQMAMQQQQMAQQQQDSYNSLNGALAPPTSQPPPPPGQAPRDVKKSRRESNMQMLGYGMQGAMGGGSIAEMLSQQRKPSYQSLRQGDRDASRGSPHRSGM
ncbi:RhoGAP-domain-containing protein [Rhizodiscina lignyota]|uniref:RhoGAP-domain-containing protein n=1 Tax=Rhizodiscina lignyota TaxID=1504668 RepID=A0A9P4IHR5_9PEZI|nr:RhoGAP-domain-containing protein [Rhizodiscina lignyota]